MGDHAGAHGHSDFTERLDDIFFGASDDGALTLVVENPS